jgi:hypothetical protein
MRSLLRRSAWSKIARSATGLAKFVRIQRYSNLVDPNWPDRVVVNMNLALCECYIIFDITSYCMLIWYRGFALSDYLHYQSFQFIAFDTLPAEKLTSTSLTSQIPEHVGQI